MLSAVTVVLVSKDVGVGRINPRLARTSEVLILSTWIICIAPFNSTLILSPTCQPLPPCNKSTVVVYLQE